MVTLDWLSSILYVLIGVLALFGVLQVWQLLQRQPGPGATGSSRVRWVDPGSIAPAIRREWLWEKLTPREMQVAQLVCEGKHNAEIAENLSISVRTVQTHTRNIYEKLHVHSRTQLAHMMRDLVD